MRVTILTSEYPPFVYGGVGVHLRYLTQQFLSERMGRRIELDVRYFGEQDISDTALEVRAFGPWDVATDADDERLGKALAPLSTDVAMVSTRVDADLVHAHTWYTFFAGHLAKMLYDIPFVVTVHSLEPKRPWKEEQLGRGYLLSRWLERTGVESADKVIAVSEGMRRDILEVYDVDPQKVVVVHNGVDLAKYRPSDAVDVRAKYGLDDPYVLFVGRISRQKGIDVLLDAADKLESNVKVVLAATSADTEELGAELVERVGDNPRLVWINEMVEEDALISLYTQAELFVCPSVYEPFGIINLEAMACGTPVVASAVGGIVEVVVDGETGTLVQPSDSAMLAGAVDALMADDRLRERYSTSGRRRVEERFSWERIARLTLGVYDAAMAK
jgi:alpha-maltose-1-phosphate synthase